MGMGQNRLTEPHTILRQYNFVIGRLHMHKSKVNPVNRLGLTIKQNYIETGTAPKCTKISK